MTPLGALFYLFAALGLGAAVLTATRRNPVHAVCSAVAVFLSVGAMLAVLGAPLPGVLTVVVYAGAIMVLFLFVIMLLGLPAGDGTLPPGRFLVPATLAAATLVALFALIGADPSAKTLLPAAMAGPAAVGTILFDKYWLAVEAVSILLFAALAAVMLLGRGKTGRNIAAAGGRAA